MDALPPPVPALEAVMVPAPATSKRLTEKDYRQMVPRHKTHPTLIPDTVDDPRLVAILEAVMEGRHGFRAACVAQGWKPNTVRGWVVRDTPDGFRAAYKEARRIEMDTFSDEMLVTAEGKDREGRDTAGAVYRDQLDIKTKQWMMARRAPEDFGDRGAVDEQGKPIARQVIVIGKQTISF